MSENDITIRLPGELFTWLELMVEKGVFATRAHGLKLALKDWRRKHPSAADVSMVA